MLELYNTMSRAKEPFQPRKTGQVKMFTCGPSIYRRPHVGNYRSFLWEDVLQRYLEYMGLEVERVINFTDVEDKAIAEAQSEGVPLLELTGKISERFFQEAAFLNIKLPAEVPRSSTSVDQAVKLIEILLEKGFAYWDAGDVFFDALKFKGFGKLFRLDMSRWPREKRLFRRDTYNGRRWNLGDFVLWHGWKEGEEIFWDTKIGKGRPAWNVQDPAMITEGLGYAIDISCGGVDNLYRHHDYNIAVIEAASGEEFARFWIHGEHLLSNGKKMSKSLGNIIYTEDLQKEAGSGRGVRFVLLGAHHRKPLNLTRRRIAEAVKRFNALMEMVEKVTGQGSGPPSRARGADGSSGGAAVRSGHVPDGAGTAPAEFSREYVEALIGVLRREFEANLNDDLNAAGALDSLFSILEKLALADAAGALDTGLRKRIEEELRKIDSVLQVLFE